MNNLSLEQRLLYTAMMMPVDKIPNFWIPVEVVELGKKIKRLFDEGKLTDMYLDEEGNIICR